MRSKIQVSDTNTRERKNQSPEREEIIGLSVQQTQKGSRLGRGWQEGNTLTR